MRREFFTAFKNSKAFSLLEMLVALSLFAFLFLFITQLVRQNHRQVTKIKEDLKFTGSIHHIVHLIKQDLSSAAYFLDLSYNFRTHFPLRNQELSKGAPLTPLTPLTPQAVAGSTPAKTSPFKNNILLDNGVVFEGSSQEMQFVSYSFSKDSSLKQWMKIRYVAEDCPSDRSSGVCLMRYERPDWNRSLSQIWEEPALVVKEGLESIRFLYSDDYSLSDTEWREEWEPEKAGFPSRGEESSFGNYASLTMAEDWPQEFPLPARVQIIFKKKDSPDEQWVFPVSQIRLKEWSPFLKGLKSFEKWSPPKEEPKEKENQPLQQRGLK